MEQTKKQYSVLIIDDEPHVLEGMKMMIDWNQLQCGQVYYCESSEEAHRVMAMHTIDLIITDIRLPGESGLDFVQSVKAQSKNIKTLVMSGYRDFEYVKKAMTLGVDGYIVKPVFEEEVCGAVKNLIEDLNKKDLMNHYAEASNVFRIKKYLVHDCPLDDQGENVSSYLKRNAFFLLACWGKKKRLCEALIKEIISYESSDGKGTILYADNYGVICLVKKNTFIEWMDILIKNKEDVIWEQTQVVKDIDDLKKKFIQYKRMMPKLCHYLDGDYILDRSFKREERFLNDEIELYKKMKTEILENNGNDLFLYFENFFYLLWLRCHDLNAMKKRMLDVYYQLVMDMQFLLEKENVLQMYRDLPEELNSGTAEDVICFFEKRMRDIMKISIKDCKKNKGSLICTVEQWMDENLEENITLKKLAKEVHLHPAYLGQKLFDKWGESFQRRLNRMRIEKAIELLENKKGQLAIEESAYQVGYKNYMTFLKYFKMFYGTVPKEYMEKNKN